MDFALKEIRMTCLVDLCTISGLKGMDQGRGNTVPLKHTTDDLLQENR